MRHQYGISAVIGQTSFHGEHHLWCREMLAVFSHLFMNGKGHFVSIIHLGFLSQILADALKEFGRMIDGVEDERDRMVCV